MLIDYLNEFNIWLLEENNLNYSKLLILSNRAVKQLKYLQASTWLQCQETATKLDIAIFV